MRAIILCLALSFATTTQAQMRPHLEKRCEKNDSKACLKAGERFFKGQISWLHAEPYFKRACRLKLPKACFFLALKYRRDSRTGLARKYLERACKQGLAAGCYGLALIVVDTPSPIGRSLGRQYFLRACELGYANGCLTAGTMLQRGDGGAVDLPQAARILGRGCQLKSKLSCTAAAALALKSKNDTLAASLFQRACKLGDAGGCFNLGQLRRMADSASVGARQAYRRACTLGSADGCISLAGMLFAAGDKKDGKTRRLLRRACRSLKSARGCFNLGLFFHRGLGGPQDLTGSLRWFRRGCKLKHGRSCFNAAELYRSKLRGRVDLKAAMRYLQLACGLNDASGCELLGELSFQGNRGKTAPKRARVLLKKACRLKAARGCHNLAHLHRTGLGGPRNLAFARQYYERACKLGWRGSCLTLAQLIRKGLFGAPDFHAARRLFRRACDLGSGHSCANLGALMLSGTVGKQPGNALPWLRKACSGGIGVGCFNLGLMALRGIGRKRDRKDAGRLFKKSCGLGFTRGCRPPSR